MNEIDIVSQNDPKLNIRLVFVTITFALIVFYPKIVRYISPPESEKHDEYIIPIDDTIRNAFQSLSQLSKYKPEIFGKIHQDVVHVIQVHARNESATQDTLIDLQIRIRKNIDKMQLYIPYDQDERNIWENNIKAVISRVLVLIKDILSR